jgi:protein involved in polysaccharide export with SLBB domain
LRLGPLVAITFISFCTLAAKADIGALDPLAKPATRLGPSYTLALNVSVQGIDEKELCGTFILDRESAFEPTVGFKPIGKIVLSGLTVEEARKRLMALLSPYFRLPPDVRVGIAKMPRFQVVVEGAALKTGIISLPDGSRLSDLVAETGYASDANLRRVRIVRMDNGTRIQMQSDFQRVLEGNSTGEDRINDPQLKNGDVVGFEQIITPIISSPTIVLLGEVKRQGTIPLKPGMRVRDAIDAASGLTANADRERVSIRKFVDGSIISVNADKVQKNIPTDNLALDASDTIVVYPKDTGKRISVVGDVPLPRTFDYKVPITLTQAITDSGGFKPDADTHSIVIARNMLNDPSKVQQIAINYERIRKGEMPDVQLQAGDLVQVSQKKKVPSPFLNIGLMLLRTLLF